MQGARILFVIKVTALTTIAMCRNGGHMCAWGLQTFTQTCIWACGEHNTVQLCGVSGKKVALDFSTGVLIAMKKQTVQLLR
jgi:hypothetical protein